ncbi:MAG: NAD-dependent epimerase/dehydratase family protein [Acidobacteriota bacterium]
MTNRHLNLVTGAAGFSGSYVVRELLARGERVIATDLPGAWASDETRRVLAAVGVLDHPGLDIAPADLLDPATLAPLFARPITRVFHTASLYDYSAPLARLRRINVDGTANLLEAAARARLDRFVHWSTCGVFGKPYTAAAGARTNLPFTEASSSPRNAPDGATQPEGTALVNAYSVSKWQQEQLVWRWHRERGLPVTVIRPAPIYGPGSSYGHGGIILAVAQGILPVLPSDAKNYVTTSVHVADVARFACFAVDRDDTLGEDYNIVDDSIVSYHEFLHYIALLTGRRLRDLPIVRLDHVRPAFEAAAHAWRWLELKLGTPRPRAFEVQSAVYMSSSYWLSNRKSLATGFQYRYPDVREGLKDTVAWMREQGWLTDRRRLFVVSPGGAKAASLR